MNRMTRWDPVCHCYKAVREQEQGRSVIQELGVYESIHEEEIKKAVNIGDIRDMYFTGAAQLDPYWENFGKEKAAPDNWISVTKQLPLHMGEVLVCSKEGYIFIGYIAEDNGKLEWRDQGWEHEYNLDEILKWQPLPDPCIEGV